MDTIDYLLSAIYEDYVGKIRKYCLSHRNCETCRFYNGTCRLNNFPFNWTEVKHENYSENENNRTFREIWKD